MRPVTTVMQSISVSSRRLVPVALAVVLFAAWTSVLEAHGVSGKDAVFLQGLQGRAIGPLMYLGAKHMVTGYDHLLFLVGVIFFLYRLGDVVQYVSLFTIGHSVTLLLGVLGGIRANPYLIDAIIGFSVVYKAFENMDGFRRYLGFQPNTRVAVLVFGLFHGFGLPPSCRISRSHPTASSPTSSASTSASRSARASR
jgi:hypothetical protein